MTFQNNHVDINLVVHFATQVLVSPGACVCLCLWLCVCGCVCDCACGCICDCVLVVVHFVVAFVTVFVVAFVIVCLWLCICGFVCGCVFVVVFVVVCCGRGPAGNTGRGRSWSRSGKEHWARMVVVEVRQGTLGVDGGG